MADRTLAEPTTVDELSRRDMVQTRAALFAIRVLVHDDLAERDHTLTLIRRICDMSVPGRPTGLEDLRRLLGELLPRGEGNLMRV